MKLCRIRLTLSLALGVTALGAASARGENPAAEPLEGKIAWVYDYGEGKRLSESTKKPIFVVFRCER